VRPDSVPPAPKPTDGAPRLARALLFGVLGVALLAHVLVTMQPMFPDEFLVLGNFWDFVQERTIIPGHTQYPALYSYLAAPVTGLFVALSVAVGVPPSAADVSEWIAYRPELGMWPARLVSLACWCVCVWAVWRIAREMLRDADLALLAAAAFAAAVGTLEYSGYGLPDAAMMMFASLALLYALRLARGESTRGSAILAGLLAGLAMATKYSALALAVPLLVAGLLSSRDGRERSRAVGVMAGMGAVGLLVGCPGWLLAPAHYWHGLMVERAHMATGHLGYTGVPLLGQLELLATADPLVLVLALAGAVAFAVRGGGGRRAQYAVLVATVAAVLAVAAPAKKQSLQYLFVLYPALGLLAACLPAAATGRTRRALATTMAVALLLCAAWGMWWGYRVALLPDSRVVARQWINGSLPEGAVVAVDWIHVPRLVGQEELAALTGDLHTDFVRDAYAGLRGFPSVEMEYTDAFLRETPAEWLITSSGCYARFFEHGRFTRIPPAEGTSLRAEFDQKRAFYGALLDGRYGWRVEHEVYTGNGPRVVIFHRAG